MHFDEMRFYALSFFEYFLEKTGHLLAKVRRLQKIWRKHTHMHTHTRTLL